MYILHSIPDDDLHVPSSSVILTDALNVALSASSIILDTRVFCKDLVPPILSHQFSNFNHQVTALNLNAKVAYSKHQWDAESFKFDEYYTIAPISAPADADIEQVPPGQAQYGCSWVLAAVQACQASDRTQLRPCAELMAYLQSPLEQMEDVVGWWGLLKSAYCNGHISAPSDAEQHLDSLIAALRDNTDDEDGELV
ncbi:hypothetical protein BDR03DRAFT_983239 [Suillus americanus]|nr:hypothetical protein BDR03DRAFT_983239 [Suillus americanus]